MVVVSMAFIAIIVGALLTAAGYAYRMKMQDLNARDNFYYVEHAMEEIYAGVGSETVENMQEAYIYTVEHMVRYDVDTQTYVAIDDAEAEKMFKDRFMSNISNNDYFSDSNLSATLGNYISDSTVELDTSNLYVKRDYVNVEGKTVLDKITIKNVAVTRTVKYDKSIANGDYTQTISADIEIGNPDFDVLFNTTGTGQNNIFTYAMLADMGVEVNQTSPLLIAGNIYAASDYYNKQYNDETMSDTNTSNKYPATAGENEISYNHIKVTSKKYADNDTSTYYNKYSTISSPEVSGQRDNFDGINTRSKYSGLYIDKGNVSILADYVIVPGTIAVLNRGSLVVYGKNGNTMSEAEIWTDDVVLGGYSSILASTADDDDPTYVGPSANLRAELYVKDDTELNASNSFLKLDGSYYGYGDSTEKDDRVFGPAVDKSLFQVYATDNLGDLVHDSNGNLITENRGHYNSSAIIVNGERSTLDLQLTDTIYLAGRSYIELSRYISSKDDEDALKSDSAEFMSGDIANDTTIINRQTIEYFPETTADKPGKNADGTQAADTVFTRDYKTGESLSLKTSQLAYIPVQSVGIPDTTYGVDNFTKTLTDGDGQYIYFADLHPALRGSALFEKYFPANRFYDFSRATYPSDPTPADAMRKYAIPVIIQEVSGKKYYYYDLERAYNQIKRSNIIGASYIDEDAFVAEFPTAEDYAASFIRDYVAELNNPNSTIAEYLTDIRDYEDFEAGNIILPDSTKNPQIYSTGAITSKAGTQFDVVVDGINLNNLFSSSTYGGAGTVATDFSDNLDLEYAFIKWNLGHSVLADTDPEKVYIKNMVAENYGSYITPINKFMNFDKIPETDAFKDKKITLSSGYTVIVSWDDITLDESDEISGIIITKGDVTFGNNVTSFQGLIIAGGKIYINGSLQTMTASAEICRTILRECQLSGSDDCKYLLSLFKGYEDSVLGEKAVEDTDVKTIDTIDYSDVCKISNWMKNVE